MVRPNGETPRDYNTLFTAGAIGGLSDEQLLERFSTRRDEVAFESLVARHARNVLGVCHGILTNSHDVEDAFQATFLELVKKAGSIRHRDRLGPWLHGVACRLALRTRAKVARRRSREMPWPEVVAAASCFDGEEQERRAALLEEIHHLPDKYREPLLLCKWEGLTQREAAKRLGCPEGTVPVRIAKGRELLRKGMARRGLVPSASGEVIGPVHLPPVPSALVTTTVKAALAAAGKGASPIMILASMPALVTGGAQAMRVAFLGSTIVAASLLTVAAVTGAARHGGGAVHAGTGAGSHPSKTAGVERTQPGATATREAKPVAPAQRATAEQKPAIMERAQAIARLRELGAKLTTDGDRTTRVTVSGPRIDDDVLKLLVLLPEIEVLEILDAPGVSDAGVSHLGVLRSLRDLTFRNVNVSDGALKVLGRLTNLHGLELNKTPQVRGPGLASLDGLPRLAKLYILNNRLDPGAAEVIGNLKGLQFLDFQNTDGVTDESLAHLSGLTELRELGLRHTHVGDSGLAHLQKMAALRRLDLIETHVTAAGLVHLKKLPALAELWRQNTRLSERDARGALPGLKSLK